MDKFTNGDEHYPDEEEYVTVQSCIDSVRGKEVFVLATANRIRALPQSLLRAGRFDRIIEVNNPRGEDAVKITEHYLRKKKFKSDIAPVVIEKMMDGCSCAELETVINEAGLYAGFERSDTITMNHFLKACLHTVHAVPCEALNVALTGADLANGEDEKTQVTYHEAGHATVAEVLKPGSVTLISAYSREAQPGGFTSYDCSDSNLSVKSTYARICVLLGGMAALEQKFGLVDVGSSNDLDQAFQSVWKLVTRNCACGFSLHNNGFDDSQELVSKQEQAVSAEIERCYRKTKEILSVNHELLELIATELAASGVLTAADISRIKQRCRIIPVHI